MNNIFNTLIEQNQKSIDSTELNYQEKQELHKYMKTPLEIATQTIENLCSKKKYYEALIESNNIIERYPTYSYGYVAKGHILNKLNYDKEDVLKFLRLAVFYGFREKNYATQWQQAAPIPSGISAKARAFLRNSILSFSSVVNRGQGDAYLRCLYFH